jgi:hypothetical protein
VCIRRDGCRNLKADESSDTTFTCHQGSTAGLSFYTSSHFVSCFLVASAISSSSLFYDANLKLRNVFIPAKFFPLFKSVLMPYHIRSWAKQTQWNFLPVQANSNNNTRQTCLLHAKVGYGRRISSIFRFSGDVYLSKRTGYMKQSYWCLVVITLLADR